MSLFDLVFLIFGVIGVLGGAWPLLSGRNFPGLLGRGFTRKDNLKLQRAPAVYFRAMGATIVSSGVLIFCVGALIWFSAGPRTAELAAVEVIGVVAGIAFCCSLAWLVVVNYRHRLFRWNAP
ncbi:MAG TPA: hypothetical protein VNU19_01530 [Candidatus Acidoferrum sp.]|nr:hypothetical protein [Candidatus Acidoferrum sp.]